MSAAPHRRLALAGLALALGACGDSGAGTVTGTDTATHGHTGTDTDTVTGTDTDTDTVTAADTATGTDTSTAADTATPPDTSPLGGLRPAPVYLPTDYTADRAWPLVILLHGYSASGQIQDLYLGFSRRATELGFIAVVPEGTKSSIGQQFWNASPAYCCDFEDSGVDDDAYLMGLVDEASARFNVDPDRVSFFGHSNGGFMAHELACAHADRIASIASLAGSLPASTNACQPSAPVSVLQIHGTLDDTIVYGGSPGLFPGAVEVAQRWASYDGCAEPAAALGPYDYTGVPGDETTGRRWSDCAGSGQVALWTLNGDGHIPSFQEGFLPAALGFLLDARRAGAATTTTASPR